MMRDLKDVVKLNSFQEICTVANEEQWCWNIACGTCGHGNFVKSLLLLIDEKEPYPFYGRDMRDLLCSRADKVQEKVKDVSIDYFANNFKFPDFLGYLGIALRYSEDAEKENRVLTTTWIPQLILLMDADKGKTYSRKNLETGVWEPYTSKKTSSESLQAILTNNEVLTWMNLEYAERGYSHLRH
jgi:hypothetical protein